MTDDDKEDITVDMPFRLDNFTAAIEQLYTADGTPCPCAQCKCTVLLGLIMDLNCWGEQSDYARATEFKLLALDAAANIWVSEFAYGDALATQPHAIQAFGDLLKRAHDDWQRHQGEIDADDDAASDTIPKNANGETIN